MKNPVKISALAFVAATFLLGGAPRSHAQGSCNNYTNSSANYFDGYGWVCSYTGPGCTECAGVMGGGVLTCTQTAGHPTICIYEQRL